MTPLVSSKSRETPTLAAIADAISAARPGLAARAFRVAEATDKLDHAVAKACPSASDPILTSIGIVRQTQRSIYFEGTYKALVGGKTVTLKASAPYGRTALYGVAEALGQPVLFPRRSPAFLEALAIAEAAAAEFVRATGG